MAYILPQLQVFQSFRRSPQNVVENLNAFIFGPHYRLFRYDVASEKELIGLGSYDSSKDVVYPWPGLPADGIVDTDRVKLYAENVWAEYLHIAEYEGARIVDDSELNKVRVENMVLASGHGLTRSAGLPRDVAAGDRVRYEFTDNATGKIHSGTTKVIGLEPDTIAATASSPDANADNMPSTTATEGLGDGLHVAGLDGSSAEVFAMSEEAGGLGTVFSGSLSAGVVRETITATILSLDADSGRGLARVSYSSGRASVDNVLVHGGGNYWHLLLGYNLHMRILNDIHVGMRFRVELAAPFARPDTLGTLADGGYTGAHDTTYMLTVVRGGLFERAIRVFDGGDTDVLPVVGVGTADGRDWSTWLGGDRDDEYILRCERGGGELRDCVFSLTSLSGDNEDSIVFADGTDRTIGSRGLVARMPTPSGAAMSAGSSWVIRVNASRPQLRITDTSGVDRARYAVVSAGAVIAVGSYGVEVTVAGNTNREGASEGSGGLRKGDVYHVTCKTAKHGAIRTLVLADDLAPYAVRETPVKLWLYSFSRTVEIGPRRVQVPGSYNWEASADAGFTVHNGLQIRDTSLGDDSGNEWLDVYRADLYVEYRALLTTYSDAIRAMTDISDVETTLGTVHPDNPLAQGVYNAVLNSGDRAVYYMSIPSNDSAGWQRVLSCSALSSSTYALVPLTQDKSILDAVEGHVSGMSTESERHWRIAFVGTEMPEFDPIYTQVSHPTGDEFLATISAGRGGFTELKFVDPDGDPATHTDALRDLRAGDRIRINFATDAWGSATYEEYEVDRVLTRTGLRLESGPAYAVDFPAKVQAFRRYTTAEMAEAVAAISSGFYNRRIYHVFPSYAVAGGTIQTSPFIAAAVAGLSSSVLPQQPLTNIELNGFDDLPLVYQMFDRAQLDTMAGSGTLIVMQDTAGGRVYVRHQVSTKAKDGNLNETELSITRNLDSISYFFAAQLAPYIGRYNITPNLLSALELIMTQGFNYLGSLTGFGLLGPQIDLERTRVVSVAQHPVLEDHVIILVDIALPRPLNVLQLRFVV